MYERAWADPCAECDHVAAATAFHRLRRRHRCPTPDGSRGGLSQVLAPLAAGLGVVIVAAVSAAMLITPATRTLSARRTAAGPPLGTPVENNPRFSSDDGAFSVAYPAEAAQNHLRPARTARCRSALHRR